MSAWTRQKFWITKDGRRITPAKMTDSHLLNTLRWLERWATYYITVTLHQYLTVPEPRTEAAADCFGREFQYWLDLTPCEYLNNNLPIYPKLTAEVERRLLPWGKAEAERAFFLKSTGAICSALKEAKDGERKDD